MHLCIVCSGLVSSFSETSFPISGFSLTQVLVKLMGIDFTTITGISPIIKSHQDPRGAIKRESETQGDVSGVEREIWVGSIQLVAFSEMPSSYQWIAHCLWPLSN